MNDGKLLTYQSVSHGRFPTCWDVILGSNAPVTVRQRNCSHRVKGVYCRYMNSRILVILMLSATWPFAGLMGESTAIAKSASMKASCGCCGPKECHCCCSKEKPEQPQPKRSGFCDCDFDPAPVVISGRIELPRLRELSVIALPQDQTMGKTIPTLSQFSVRVHSPPPDRELISSTILLI